MNQLKKITTRAKQIRKKHPSMQWKNAVKKAGAEYRSGKIGKVKTKKFRQTGSSNKTADKKRTARAPGKRRSATGRTYFERRKNRSDVPGAMTGVSTGRLGAELRRRKETELANAFLRKEKATTVKSYRAACKAIIEKRAALRRLQ